MKRDFNNNEDTDWLSAYMDYVENGNFDSDDYSGYSFIYLDNDEIPELVIHGNYEAAGNIICSYYNGLISELYTARLMFSFLEKQGLLCSSDGNMGYYYDIVYSLENGEFTKIGDGSWNETVVDENISFEYFWNGEQLTADEYHNALAQIYNEENAISSLGIYSSISEAYENIDTTTSKSDDSVKSTEDIAYESTEETYDVLEIYINYFEVENGRLVMQTDTVDDILDIAISSDCIWGSINVGEAEPTESNTSYEKIKEKIDTARSRYEQEGMYDSPLGVYIVVKDGVVMKVYTVLS